MMNASSLTLVVAMLAGTFGGFVAAVTQGAAWWVIVLFSTGGLCVGIALGAAAMQLLHALHARPARGLVEAVLVLVSIIMPGLLALTAYGGVAWLANVLMHRWIR